MVLRELSRLGPSIRPRGELLFLLMQKNLSFVPDSEVFNSCIGDGFLVPELKGDCEASEDIGTKAFSNKIIRKNAICMVYVDLQEDLRSGDVMGLWVGETRARRSEQISAAENVIGVNWWPCQTATAAAVARAA